MTIKTRTTFCDTLLNCYSDTPPKRYSKIKDLTPGTKFIGNRTGKVFTLLEPNNIRYIDLGGNPEVDTPAISGNTVYLVASHEIVELV